MAFNNVLPAWVLMPYRAICDTGSAHSAGFKTRAEAEGYIASHSESKFRLLTDEDEGTSDETV